METNSNKWGFYGRREELNTLTSIMNRQRWFFVKITGRRRIGKTTLIQHALQSSDRPLKLYIQIPDSDASGVIAAANNYLRLFGISNRQINNLLEFAGCIGQLVGEGYVVVLDEFQYFNRKHLYEFNSFLQHEVDQLANSSENVNGGLIVLGSLHAEMAALLDGRNAPLYNRVTDSLELHHLDMESLLEMMHLKGKVKAAHMLFLWNLFEGVPKFYRDAFEQGVLDAERKQVLSKMFFSSSSPLRSEADHWFLSELRGRYDALLQLIANKPGCTHAEIQDATRSYYGDDTRQIGAYLKILSERYRMIERKLPLFSSPKARAGRYYISDNFLRSWLSALKLPVSAVNFRPVDGLVEMADRDLMTTEGFGFEKMVGNIYEELSRKNKGDFPLTHRIAGYWDRKDTEIDLIAISDLSKTIRFGSCKRNESKLEKSLPNLHKSADTFIKAHRQFADYKQEYLMISPEISNDTRHRLQQNGLIVQSLRDLLQEL
ncbi:MAG TPA: ATP-binding protein [Bacteroidales bacterium]|nr:ATP-binding protein [Bacteroidales bacterium]HRZ48701.1 ATP-binding protein [Bacteroidales bacterium]